MTASLCDERKIWTIQILRRCCGDLILTQNGASKNTKIYDDASRNSLRGTDALLTPRTLQIRRWTQSRRNLTTWKFVTWTRMPIALLATPSRSFVGGAGAKFTLMSQSKRGPRTPSPTLKRHWLQLSIIENGWIG